MPSSLRTTGGPKLPVASISFAGSLPNTIASRANRAGNEGEEGERPWWEWRRPAVTPHFEPPPPRFEADLEQVDEAASDLLPELDWAALPRWMRSVPEQGPPDEVECEAGSGPGWE